MAKSSSSIPVGPRRDNARITDLRKRYSDCCVSWLNSRWSEDYVTRELEMKNFRGDSCYLWQTRDHRWQASGMRPEDRLRAYAAYVSSFDTLGLIEGLGEDGAFGAVTASFNGGLVSRDLLDSINEIYFLDRNWSLLSRREFCAVDIGAGYGRLAHRILSAAGGLDSYFCLDSIPESTFLCEWYLNYRNTENVNVVPFHELWRWARDARCELGVNIHSFSEMPFVAIVFWLEVMSQLQVQDLLVISNEGPDLYSWERSGTRRDCLPLFEQSGFDLSLDPPGNSGSSFPA
jgi:hypothetical protein